MLGKRRNTIVVEFKRNGLDSSRVEDVEIYLRGRVEELPEKIMGKQKEVVKIPMKVDMKDIMKKVGEILEPKVESGIPGIYVPQVGADGFYED